jgi:hypothetical protein
MATFFVDKIEAKSDIPLYLYLNPGRKVIHTNWQELWRAPNTPTPNSAAAFNLSNSGASVALAVTCRVDSSLVGKALTVVGRFNNAVAVSSSCTFPNTDWVVVQNFSRISAPPFPIAYVGDFRWHVRLGTTVVATFGTPTRIEWYTVARLADLWHSYGVSVNLLRRYLVRWSTTTRSWLLPAFYDFTARQIFDSPFKYDVVNGGTRYMNSGTGGPYKLDQYFKDLNSPQPSDVRINCYDMAGIVQLVLSLFLDYSSVRWAFMQPYGYINTTL